MEQIEAYTWDEKHIELKTADDIDKAMKLMNNGENFKGWVEKWSGGRP